MRFQRLPDDELKKLEKEFIQFLVSNTVTAEDWEKLKRTNLAKAQELIDMFSDIVYEKVMQQIDYLEIRNERNIQSYLCEKDQIHLFALDVDESLIVDFRKAGEIKKLDKYQNELGEKIQLYSATKAYEKNREDDIFDMMANKKAFKTDKTFYNLLKKLNYSMKKINK